MALLTDLTICPNFDQTKKNKQNLEKINSRIGENKLEKRSHEWAVCQFFHSFLGESNQRRYRLKLNDPLKGGWVSRPRHVSVCRWPKMHSDEVEMRFFAWLLRWKWWTPRLSPSYLSSQTVHLSRKSKMYSTWVSLTDFLTFLLVKSFRIFDLKNCKLWNDSTN